MISENPILRLALFLGLLVIMFFVEGRHPLRAWKESRKDRIFFSIKLAVLNNIAFRVLIATPFVALTHAISESGVGLLPWLRGFTGLEPTAFLLIEIPLCILAFDFFDYAKHRWFHRVTFMWRTHRVHHTDTHLDVLTALRYHPGELLISSAIKAGWLVLLGPTAFTFMVFEIVLNMASQFHHANIDLPKRLEKWLHHVLVTPRYHAMHHTIHREVGDYNFSTIFSVWDRLFRTQKIPELSDIDLERLGLLQNNHLNLWEVLKSPALPDSSTPSTQRKDDVAHLAPDFALIKSRRAGPKKPILVDVRERDEIDETGLPPEALWLPTSRVLQDKKLVEQLVQKFGKERDVYFYCAAGLRSEKVRQVFAQKGVKAHNLGNLEDVKLQHMTLKPFREEQGIPDWGSTATPV